MSMSQFQLFTQSFHNESNIGDTQQQTQADC